MPDEQIPQDEVNKINQMVELQVRQLIGDLNVQLILLRNMYEQAKERERAQQVGKVQPLRGAQ